MVRDKSYSTSSASIKSSQPTYSNYNQIFDVIGIRKQYQGSIIDTKGGL